MGDMKPTDDIKETTEQTTGVSIPSPNLSPIRRVSKRKLSSVMEERREPLRRSQRISSSSSIVSSLNSKKRRMIGENNDQLRGRKRSSATLSSNGEEGPRRRSLRLSGAGEQENDNPSSLPLKKRKIKPESVVHSDKISSPGLKKKTRGRPSKNFRIPNGSKNQNQNYDENDSVDLNESLTYAVSNPVLSSSSSDEEMEKAEEKPSMEVDVSVYYRF